MHTFVKARAALGVAGVATLVASLMAPHAHADSGASIAYGWWSATAVNAVPGQSVPAPPDVPADGMETQGGTAASGPTALAAVQYTVDAGVTVSSVVLTLVGSAPHVSSGLTACLATGTVLSEQNGPLADAPKYGTSCVPATIANGTATFATGGLAQPGGVLAVVLVGATPADRFVFAKPDDASVHLTGTSTSAPTDASTSGTSGDPGAGAASGPAQAAAPPVSSGGGVTAPVAFPPAAPALDAAAPQVAALPPNAQPSLGPGPVVAPTDPQLNAATTALASRTPTTGGKDLGTLAGLALLAAAGLWTASSSRAGHTVLAADPADERPDQPQT